MGARMIDVSRLSERQLCEVSRRMGRKGGHARLAYRPEPVDDSVFAPLCESIARDGCRLDAIEENFRASRLRRFDAMRHDGFRSHFSYYLGFLFETAIQMSILKFSQEIPESFRVVRDVSGELRGGARYEVDSRGSALFYRPADNGRSMKTLAEIDLVGEIRDGAAVIPVMFEITLMNGSRKDFKSRRKAALLEEIYGRKPYFCVIRPAYDDEEPGSHIRFRPERGVWRDILIPRNDSIRALASRLLEEERAPDQAQEAGAALGA